MLFDPAQGQGHAHIGHPLAFIIRPQGDVHHRLVDRGAVARRGPEIGLSRGDYLRPGVVLFHLLGIFFGIRQDIAVGGDQRNAHGHLGPHGQDPVLKGLSGGQRRQGFANENGLDSQTILDLLEEVFFRLIYNDDAKESNRSEREHGQGAEQPPKHSRTPHIPNLRNGN